MTSFNNIIERELVVFDFDETIVDCNSDTWIHQLAPNGKVPSHISWSPGQDYFCHVQGVLKYLHSINIQEQALYECLRSMPVVGGIENLIRNLGKKSDRYEVIILSDANSYFIDSFLKAKNLDTSVKAVLTNKGCFNSLGLLEIEEFHHQCLCSLSPRNLCKGEALKEYLTKQLVDSKIIYPCINYVGDGQNDLCPSIKLTAHDRVFPRLGYPLSLLCDKLKKDLDLGVLLAADCSKTSIKLDADVIHWKDGQEICDVILSKAK